MEVVKKYWKAIVAIIIILLIVWGFTFVTNKFATLKSQNANLIHSRDSSFLVARQYVNKNGELINQVNTYELKVRDIKEIGEQLGFDKKQLQDQVGNLKNLVAYWKGQASTSGGGVVTLHDTTYIDSTGQTLNAQKFDDWTNNYLSLSGEYIPTTKKLSFTYKYDLGGFDITAYYKKTGFLKSEQLVTDIKFGDPHMKVLQFQGLVIQQPKKKFYQTKAFAFGVGFAGGTYLVLRYR